MKRMFVIYIGGEAGVEVYDFSSCLVAARARRHAACTVYMSCWTRVALHSYYTLTADDVVLCWTKRQNLCLNCLEIQSTSVEEENRRLYI